MVAKGYTSAELVFDELGDAFDTSDAAIVDYCNTLIAQAEAYIDRYTARAWAVASPVTNELHTVQNRYLYLKSAPVTAITSFTVRLDYPGATDTVLTAGSDYELLDAEHGIVLVNAAYPFGRDIVVNTTAYAGYIARVSYTTTTPVPGDIERAATLLVASWLASRGSASAAIAAGIKSYGIGNDLMVTFRDPTGTGVAAVPTSVADLLNRRRAVLMA